MTLNESKEAEQGLSGRFGQLLGGLRSLVAPARRMRDQLIALMVTITIGGLIVVMGFAAYLNVIDHGWNADAAAWAQAAGSIIAIAGAAWLARAEARQARRWRRQQGEEAGYAVRFVLSQAQLDAHIIAFEISKKNQVFTASDIRSWRQRSANASLALQALLNRTDYIHPAMVVTTSNAKILVDGLSVDLERFDQIVKSGATLESDLTNDIVYVHINLGLLIDQYDERIRGLREALDRGSDTLPLAEYYKSPYRRVESPSNQSSQPSAGEGS